jgi:hypothetical protein
VGLRVHGISYKWTAHKKIIKRMWSGIEKINKIQQASD